MAAVQIDRRATYLSYIPHAFVADWTDDGSPAAVYGAQIALGGTPPADDCRAPLRFGRRMARRDDKRRLRFLPLHLAMEGYLSLHFGGPTVVWEEWSRRAVRHGLSPREEQAYLGAAVHGLDEAMRVFEVLPGQCGVVVYVADALATAFVVPHPDDYRALHRTLLEDCFGELIYHYGYLYPTAQDVEVRLADSTIRSLADLRAQVQTLEREWKEFHNGVMAGGLLDAAYTFEQVYRMGPYALERFLPRFERRGENHIGERITDADGRLAYLHTFRLSAKQVKRGHLLTQLAAHDWHLADTAADLAITPAQLALRIEAAGFGALLRQDVLDHYRAQVRRGTDT
jgi:hypothetical protein